MASPAIRGPARSQAAPQFAAGERFLTVGVVAEHFGVTEVTIKNWVDAGQLLAARTVGGHRRIAASSVAKLLEEQGRPVPPTLARRKPLVVVLDTDAAWLKTIKRALSARTRVEVEGDPYLGLLMIARLRPDIVLVDLHLAHGDGKRLISALRTDPQTKPIETIAIGVNGADSKAIAPLLTTVAAARGSGSLVFFRRADANAVVDAVLQRADRPASPPRARRR
jgi:excisionase family DNA binding protein